jgi:TonB family protein
VTPVAGAAARVSAAIAVSAALHTAVLAGAPGLFGPSAPAGARGAPLEVRLVAEHAPKHVKPTPRQAAPKAGSRLAAEPKAGVPEGPHYYRGSELDYGPAPLTPIEPAAAVKTPGRVIARVLINESGGADAVRIEASEPLAVFDEAVKAAFGAARYRPGMKEGRSVKSQMLVEVVFHGAEAAGADSARPH